MLRFSVTQFKTSIGAAFALGLAVTSIPAQAQEDTEVRVRALEAQVRALQRVVFPGGEGRFFEPQVDRSPASQSGSQAGTPATGAVTDILARLDALESELARLTSLSEENRNDLRGIDTRLTTLESAAETKATAAATQNGGTPARVATGGSEPREEPSAERVAAVAAVVKPQSDDPGEDEYTYGFRLWDAGFYPEARQQLKIFVRDYPDHSLVSYGRNLIGRAYLDDGDPEQAAAWFVENYTSDKNGRRAADSVLYLAIAMIRRDETERACTALGVFSREFATEAVGRLETLYNTTRERVDCS